MTFQAIADALNAEGIPTAHGGKWRPSTIVEEAREREREPEPERE
jgi:Recombinase